MSLDYDLSYHQHCLLALSSGRSVVLEALHQRMTYAGLVEGVPFKEANDRLVDGALHDAQRHCVPGAWPHLVLPPARRDHLRRPGDAEGGRALGGRPVEWLPKVTVVAVFRDVFPARDTGMDQSYLTAVWFQGEFALPIEAAALDQLRTMDWEALATDVER